MTETKKTRTPKGVESITKGALKLPLADRVALVKSLKDSITDEVATLKLRADEATKTINGL